MQYIDVYVKIKRPSNTMKSYIDVLQDYISIMFGIRMINGMINWVNRIVPANVNISIRQVLTIAGTIWFICYSKLE